MTTLFLRSGRSSQTAGYYLILILLTVLFYGNVNAQGVSETSMDPHEHRLLNEVHSDSTSLIRPIPASGLFYTIQLGVYSKPRTSKDLFEMKPLFVERLPGGRFRYVSGVFDNLNAARVKYDEARMSGFTDSFVTAYYNGTKTTVTKARALIQEFGTEILITSAKAEYLSDEGNWTIVDQEMREVEAGSTTEQLYEYEDAHSVEAEDSVSGLDTEVQEEVNTETLHTVESPLEELRPDSTQFDSSQMVLDNAQIQSIQPDSVELENRMDSESTTDEPFLIRIQSRNDRDRTVESGNPELSDSTLIHLLNLQIRFDPRERTPVLNVTAPGNAVRNRPVIFYGYTNYPGWIERYELRILENNVSVSSPPLAIVSSLKPDGFEFRWSAGVPEGVEVVRYVLRVYDREGRFDETTPKTLAIVDQSRSSANQESNERESRIGYGENHRSIANIPVSGVALTVNGENLQTSARVEVLGRSVPVSANGRFVARQLLPPGEHSIDISIDDHRFGRSDIRRDVYLPRRNWFHLGIADFTAGLNSVNGPAPLVTGDYSRRYRGDSYLDGRLAFYVKGDIGAETILTASADTREQSFADLFTNFGARDPQSLLRRLDSNASYPVYGDDGQLMDDAPTQGKFHVRLERHDSHLLWGSFRTPVAGTDLVRFNRGLYGAEFQHQSMSATRFGERRSQAVLFAADPGTIGSREEFRGTGGSLYYLRHQDVLLGSERIQVEVRDRESGIVLERKTLIPYQDYELNALQGRVILRSPLSSVANSNTLIRTEAVTGNPSYLVVTYEYTPMSLRVDNFTTGGRVSQWVGDHVQVGVTGFQQQGSEVEQELIGVDLTFRYRPGTYVTIEHGHSEGRGNTVLSSLDGGFEFAPLSTSAEKDMAATAQRVEFSSDFSDFSNGENDGNISAYWQQREDGYSAPGQLSSEEVMQGGVQARVPVGERLALTAKADLREGERTGESRAVEMGTDIALTRNFLLQGGVRNEHRESNLSGGISSRLSETGGRTDVIGVLGFYPVDSTGTRRGYNLYTLFQGTVDRSTGRSANDRYGIGGGLRLSDRVTLSTEFSDGDGGWGGLAETEYQITDRSSIYVNYLMDPDRADHGVRGRTGNLTTGGRIRYTEATSIFAERRQQVSESGPSGLMYAFGLDLAPADRWSWGLKLESGTLSDPLFGDIDRRAASLSAGYSTLRFRWAGALEYRTEDQDQEVKRTSGLFRNNLGLQLTSGWRALARANLAMSDGGSEANLDAEYTELVAGLAYRPVDHNRLNVLFRYTFLYDLASPDQLGARLELNPFAQRSHVYSIDGTYRLTHRLSIGGKLGYRSGEIRDRTADDSEWIGSQAWLGIARGDLHLIKSWDLIAEYRRLTAVEAQDVRSGALFGVYRQVTGNLRLGVGYNFTDYSDDLTDLSYRSQGWFVNLLGIL